MKKTSVLTCLLFIASFTVLAQTSKDFKISSIADYPTTGSKKFVFKTKLARSNIELTYNLELFKHETMVNDSTAFILFSIKNDSKKVDKGIPLSDHNICQFDKDEVDRQKKELNFSDGAFFCGYFQKVIKELIMNDLNLKNKSVYFVVLNSYDYDKVLHPFTYKTVQSAVNNWKIVAALHNSTYVYSLGILKNGVIMLDERNCPNFPHDSLLTKKLNQ
ncbi:hypothetical protein [Alistipes sp. ZOR0009]|uniref:hypothetical protein n=1 Tax=Alistipes sp. ZOR0009 TaxID=1339253 RepID=UPI0006481998|nr:hypothetical protein [Alistipes sp. ZOR0009]